MGCHQEQCLHMVCVRQFKFAFSSNPAKIWENWLKSWHKHSKSTLMVEALWLTQKFKIEPNMLNRQTISTYVQEKREKQMCEAGSVSFLSQRPTRYIHGSMFLTSLTDLWLRWCYLKQAPFLFPVLKHGPCFWCMLHQSSNSNFMKFYPISCMKCEWSDLEP